MFRLRFLILQFYSYLYRGYLFLLDKVMHIPYMISENSKLYGGVVFKLFYVQWQTYKAIIYSTSELYFLTCLILHFLEFFKITVQLYSYLLRKLYSVFEDFCFFNDETNFFTTEWYDVAVSWFLWAMLFPLFCFKSGTTDFDRINLAKLYIIRFILKINLAKMHIIRFILK